MEVTRKIMMMKFQVDKDGNKNKVTRKMMMMKFQSRRHVDKNMSLTCFDLLKPFNINLKYVQVWRELDCKTFLYAGKVDVSFKEFNRW